MKACYAKIVACFVLLLPLGLMGQDYRIEKLNSNINTRLYDEISPVLSRDGSKLYFTRVGYSIFTKTLIEGGKDLSKTLTPAAYQAKLSEVYSEVARDNISYPTESSFNQDIWTANLVNGNVGVVTHPSYPLNNALPNSVCHVSYDANSVILINQFIEGGGMRKGFSTSTRQAGGRWSFPSPIYIHEYYNNDPDVSLTVNIYDNVMILSLARDDSVGENDLYACLRTGPYSWSAPMNLGPVINTTKREITPFLSIDNRTMYFASNRNGSNGGTDIFITKRIGDGWDNWTVPRAVKTPINSTADDANPVFDFNSGYLYFSSNRDGSSDIFRVSIAPPVSDKVTVKGRILNEKTDENVGDARILAGVGDPKNFQEIHTSEDGTFKVKVPKGVPYSMIAEKPGYFGNQETVSFKANYVYFKEYEVNLTLTPIEAGTKISLKPIYFEQSKPTILENSYAALDELAQFLKENKNLYIRVEGHTDNQGKEEELKLLSEQRAEAIKDYLVYKKRIHPVRIETAGFGGSRPVNDNKTEEDRMKNRRVEAVITTVSKIMASK
ncbi:MAG: OmpA family protein [Bacteroidota bacterium]